MRIVFTGGGTGGHFYPLLAVAEEVSNIIKKDKIEDVELYYISDTSFDKNALRSYNLKFIYIPAGKIRNYTSPINILDFFKTGLGIFIALIRLFFLYPDVIFGKGGYASFPTLVAARILSIPVVIHESDTVPGRVNKWAGHFAHNVAISWSEASKYFPSEKTAITGQPIRKDLILPIEDGSFEYFSLSPDLSTITILGGSQGAVRINEFILDILPSLLEKYQIIHQTGKSNFNDVVERTRVIFQNNSNSARYKAVPFLNKEGMRRMAGITKLLVSRAGSGILEFSLWGIPSILIPIPEEISRDQRTNAYSYARRGAGIVIEEKNLTNTIFLSEIKRILEDMEEYDKMSVSAKKMTNTDAADKIARELLRISAAHK